MSELPHILATRRSVEVRSKRSALKRLLRSGRLTLADALRSTQPEMQMMRVRDVLLAVPLIGRQKADRAMRAMRMGLDLRLRGLTVRQREELICWVASNYPQVQVGLLSAAQNRSRLGGLRVEEGTQCGPGPAAAGVNPRKDRPLPTGPPVKPRHPAGRFARVEMLA